MIGRQTGPWETAEGRDVTVAKPFRPHTVRQAIWLLVLLIILLGALAELLSRAGHS